MQQNQAQLPPDASTLRVRVFVDYWNFAIALNEWAKVQLNEERFPLDWQQLGPRLVDAAGSIVRQAVKYEGMHIYMSHDPANPGNDGLRRWATNTLDRFPGVHVVMKERRRKSPPSCPQCHTEVTRCPTCQTHMARMAEKGVDTALVTDIVRLAWEDSWDMAVLVSADGDFIPAVEYLNTKGRKVIHAGFPPKGAELSRKCWGSVNLAHLVANWRR